MKRGEFNPWLELHFRGVSDAVLAELKPGEDLGINLVAEDTLYLRFNANRVRQNTDVEQITVTLRYHAEGRTVEHSRTLSGDRDVDIAALRDTLAACRADVRGLPIDPFQVEMKNNGRSHQVFRGRLGDPSTLIEDIGSRAEGSDLAGLYCGGSLARANRNSKGQDHWFANESFFVDYSLYDGNRAAKGALSGSAWTPEAWDQHLARTKNLLRLLSRPVTAVPRGRHRVYLAPTAVTEVLWLMGWGALSAGAWKQGRSPFKKLIEGETTLSPKFTVKENFALGLTPRFNAFGEVAPESVTLIENGNLKALLTSSRSAKEYSLQSNGAIEEESPRSLDVSPGGLHEDEILRQLGTGLYLSNLHYLNWSDPVSARITGMTRYACFWVEKGEIVGPIRDLRFDETLFDAFGAKLIDLTRTAELDPSIDTYGARSLGGRKAPGALIDDFTFTL